MTNKATLEEIERLSEGRTPGNWRVAPVGDYANGGINIDAGTGGYICLIDGSAEFPIEHSRADANLIAHAPRLLEIAQEQAAEIARLKQYTCEACVDADSCDRVGRAANRQCAAFRVGTKK